MASSFNRFAPSLHALLADLEVLGGGPGNRSLCLNIQERLIARLSYLERRIKNVNDELTNHKRALRTKLQPPISKEQARSIKSHINVLVVDRQNYQYMQYVIDVFVLVHSGELWKPVRDILEAAGHDTYVPSLIEFAERAHLVRPDLRLLDHVQDLVDLGICSEHVMEPPIRSTVH